MTQNVRYFRYRNNLRFKSLHSLSKFASKPQRFQVGNGQYASVLFIIPIVIDIHGHRFEIFTLVSEIYENVDLVLGIKNINELEGIMNSQESCFSFLNRSIAFFPKEQIILKAKEQQFIKIGRYPGPYCMPMMSCSLPIPERNFKNRWKHGMLTSATLASVSTCGRQSMSKPVQVWALCQSELSRW